jgi:hypothetical protein
MRLRALATLTLFLAGSATALNKEHEKFKVVGTVAALKTDEIAVKAIDGATYEMDFLDNAAVTSKSHKKVDRATLKVGEKVVVLALGHDMFDLEVYEVQLTER